MFGRKKKERKNAVVEAEAEKSVEGCSASRRNTTKASCGKKTTTRNCK